MHTLEVNGKEFNPVKIFYNPDWAGLVTVTWWEGAVKKEVELPAAVLLAAGKVAAKNNMKSLIISYIENLS